jgi:hypothetical protein
MMGLTLGSLFFNVAEFSVSRISGFYRKPVTCLRYQSFKNFKFRTFTVKANHLAEEKIRARLFTNQALDLSGWQDSNLRPPAPKAGAMTGLRYTPGGCGFGCGCGFGGCECECECVCV